MELNVTIAISVKLIGAIDSKTVVQVYLKHLNKTICVDIPNSIKQENTLRLKGLGKIAPNGEKGDLLVKFVSIDSTGVYQNMKCCNNCGQQMENDVRYCPNCGMPAQEVCQGKASGSANERRQEYVGNIKKCPSCGQEISSFMAICPSCGHELNSTKVSATLEKFITQVNVCERLVANSPSGSVGWSSWSKSKKVWWVIFNIFFSCIPLVIYLVYPLITIKSTPKLSKEEKQLASLIENFPFPNDRESILEALVYVKEKIDFISKEKIDRKSAYWMRLWCSKAEQLRQKADMMFPNDYIVKQSYEEILADEKRVNDKIKYKAIAGCILFVVAMTYLLIRNGTIDTTDYDVPLEWQTNGLFAYLPAPKIETGKITMESENRIQIDLYNVKQEDFESYVKECRTAGFTVDVTKTNSVFYADNEGGYDLNLFYNEDKKILSISLDSYTLGVDNQKMEVEETRQSELEDKSEVDEPEQNESKDKSEVDELGQNELKEDKSEDNVVSQEKEVNEIEVVIPNYSENTIEKGSVYSYGQDEWSLYVATAISDSIIKIEKWSKTLSTEKNFDLECEVGSFKITDEKNEFIWLDDEQVAFSFLLQDKNTWGFKKNKTIIFSKLASDSDKAKGTIYTKDTTCYTYRNDDWHLYKAIPLTESLFKIECWCRSLAIGNFGYGYDLYVVDTAKSDMGFEWTDDEHTSFTLMLSDDQNGDLEKETFVAFTIED